MKKRQGYYTINEEIAV